MMTKPPVDYKYLFIDMNAYFASVEQLDHPSWRGQPVAVSPFLGPSGCVIAASYEAKALGVTTGHRVGDAIKAIPSIHIAQARPRRYVQIHEQIKKIVEDYSPWIEPRSIDEFSILVSPEDRTPDRTQEITQSIKSRIRSDIGPAIRASIGIGPNVFLAKMATELKKPDGLVTITMDNLESIFNSIDEMTAICGINFALAGRLAWHNLHRPIDLWRAPANQLKNILGQPGDGWYLRLHGYDNDYLPQKIPKSVGHSHVLAPEMRVRAKARQVMHKLAYKVATRLLSQKLLATQLWIGVRFLSAGSWHQSVKMAPNNNSQDICRIALHLFDRAPEHAPLLLSVTATNLGLSTKRPQKLLPEDAKYQYLDEAQATVNHRFGPETIIPANLLAIEDAAPYRIAFGKPQEPTTKQ